MKRLLSSLLFALLLGAVMIVTPSGVAQASDTNTSVPVKFGMGGGSSSPTAAAGVTLDYETFWVGPWTLKHGWGGPDASMSGLRSKGVTPAIHYYYWGDDISPSCVEDGCWSDLHGAWKDKAGWQRLADELVQHLHSQMQGDEVIVFLETEFNKGGIAGYEPFDGYLAEKAAFIKKGYPNATVVLPFGNWNKAAWGNFDRAAAASDMVGIQGMRGSTRDSYSHYRDLFESTVSGAKYVKTLFDKPTMVHDLALSSYPEPEYREYQRAELAEFFTGMPDLKAAGVEAIIYRSWYNSNMDLANYYGMAERYWGFADRETGWKPAANVWLDGIKAERAASATPTPPGEAPGLSASFRLGNINEWWVETYVTATNPIAKVEAQVNGGAWTDLPARSWGSHAQSFHVAKGSDVVFRATDTYGQTKSSGTYDWLVSSTPSEPSEPDPEPEPQPGPYEASFRLGNVNEWWVETYVDAASAPAKVEVQVDGGSWLTLAKKSWGAYASSHHVPTGSQVVLRATDAAGATATSETYTWLERPNTPPEASFTVAASGLTVTFDASGSTDVDGDPLTYSWKLGDGMAATGRIKTHTYAEGGTYTVTLTVSDGKATASTTKAVSVVKPNQAPSAAFTATTSGLTVSLDASASSDPDGDALTYTWQLGDGKSATGRTATHTYAAGGTYTVTLTVSDGKASAMASRAVSATAPAPPTYDATFRLSPNVNQWWVEVYVDAGTGPTAVDVQVNGGQWVALDKKGWGSWAKSFHVPQGAQVVFRATDASGASAMSGTYAWLVAEPAEPAPTPEPGFSASFTPKHQTNRWWVEVAVDANRPLATVEACVEGKPCVQLDRTDWGSWAKSFNTAGKTLVFRATASDGATVQSAAYTWG